MSIASEILRLQGDSASIAAAIAAKGVSVPGGSGFDDYATLISQISGGGGGGGDLPITRLEYLQTDGNNYILTPIQYVSGHTYLIINDIQFVTITNGKGTGWNAGGAIVVYGSNYSHGNSNLSPSVGASNRATILTAIASGTTKMVAVYNNGTASTGSRSNSSLGTYAGNTGFPVGCLTSSGGGVPSDGTAMKIYALKIYKDNVVVFDAFPVVTTDSMENDQGALVPSGTIGLYDTITKKLYTNRGNGTDFTPGYFQ